MLIILESNLKMWINSKTNNDLLKIVNDYDTMEEIKSTWQNIITYVDTQS